MMCYLSPLKGISEGSLSVELVGLISCLGGNFYCVCGKS